MNDFICGNDIPPMRVIEDNNVDLIHKDRSNSSDNNNSGQVNACPDPFVIDTDECLKGLNPLNMYYNLIKNWNRMTTDERMLCFCNSVYHVNPQDIRRDEIDNYVNKYILALSIKTGKDAVNIHYEITNNAIPVYCIVYGPVNHLYLPYPFKTAFIRFGKEYGFITDDPNHNHIPDIDCPLHPDADNTAF